MDAQDQRILQDMLVRAMAAQRRETERAAGKPRSLKRILRMAERAILRADQNIEQAAELIPPPRSIACQAGCPYCCHIRLTASPPEILLVLAHIQDTWDAAQIETLKRKVKNTDAFTRGKSIEERAAQRLPCPLLKDGSCSVHSVRPLSCRALASVDVGACKAAYASRMQNGVPMYEPQHQIANAVGYGLHAGLTDVGYPLENVELVAALACGLNDPDLGRKWLQGTPILAAATCLDP